MTEILTSNTSGVDTYQGRDPGAQVDVHIFEEGRRVLAVVVIGIVLVVVLRIHLEVLLRGMVLVDDHVLRSDRTAARLFGLVEEIGKICAVVGRPRH